jgi:5-methyltetrahydrofolate corrinoid/iron sulfur protein methyltransferase
MIIVGELINGMYKEVGKAIRNKDKNTIQKIAKDQVAAGATILDVNTGPASAEPEEAMKWLVETIQEVVDISLALDSTKPKVIEAGLKLVKKKAMINSTSGDKEKLDILLPLAKQYNTSIIALTMDKRGIPRDKDIRNEIAANIIASSLEYGLEISELYIDPIVLPVNVAQPQIVHSLESIREIKILTDPPPKTIVGLSNVSQGSKQRPLINRTYAVMAVMMGLDAAILDPLDKELGDSIITAELLLGKHIYCDSYLDACRR